MPYDQVLVTTSPALMARLCPDLPAELSRGPAGAEVHGRGGDGRWRSSTSFREGFYWFNLPKAAGFPLLALVEHTNFVPPDKFGGDHIVYAGDYLEPGHEYFSLSQDELLERFCPPFRRFNPAFQLDWVRKVWCSDHLCPARAAGQPLEEHPAYPDAGAGLYFASMSQVYPWDRGTNFAVEIGRRAARPDAGRSQSAALAINLSPEHVPG